MAAALAASPDRLADPDAWETILRRADEATAADAEAGCTTLIGFHIRGGSLSGASSGDSAVLAISKEGRPVIVTARQFKAPPVGSGEALFIPFERVLAEPWKVLAMSDGVWKYAGWERVMAVASSHQGQTLVETLAQSARLRGSGGFQDDFTLVVFEENGNGP
jgi:serine/threonine protein phosphatase PrpC